MRWLIALGGAAGAVGRVAVDDALGVTAFPLATLLVNLSGVLALAWLIAATTDERWRAGLGTGFLGAWTTFSALAVVLDPGVLVDGSVGATLGYAAATMGGGVLALDVGRRLGGRSGQQPGAGSDTGAVA